ncbi:cilia- and flagella-associated protein 77 [Archocentrus centrarchus]|uniref:cilia- and flagella-associated protein 77 n=1 Tax=Archocentrus centrarchus TaxID=63155 RepID=UPI0011E9E984|nr:cilia- and flagella-associated protein 77 [Archocentrus centrarchus]XP_030579484.1 cilia- and flagella-associated protein 77 [Archocentrus centrarchus]
MSSSPRVGVVRRSMLNDPLLIKAPLGRSRSRGLAIPDLGFTFGVSSNSLRDGGVAEALSSWNVQPQQEESAVQVPDFVSLNREAVKSGMVKPKELSQYRAQRAQCATSKQRGSRFPQHPDQVPDITFGVRNRPSSPISGLLSHQYAQRWLDDQLSKNQTGNCKHKIKPGSITETRTSLLRRSKSLPVIERRPKPAHFAQVGPALDTFRDQEARLRAFRGRHSDSQSRTQHSVLGTDCREEPEQKMD